MVALAAVPCTKIKSEEKVHAAKVIMFFNSLGYPAVVCKTKKIDPCFNFFNTGWGGGREYILCPAISHFLDFFVFCN